MDCADTGDRTRAKGWQLLRYDGKQLGAATRTQNTKGQMMKNAKTLKKVAQILGVTYYRARKLRDAIADGYPGVPYYMIFGTKGYPVNVFKSKLEQEARA